MLRRVSVVNEEPLEFSQRTSTEMARYKKQLLEALASHGWEQLGVRADELEWWCDERWTLRSIRESYGFEIALSFVVDPHWEGPRLKAQGVHMIGATPQPPTSRLEAQRGLRLWMNGGRFDEKLTKFLRELDDSRALASSTRVERLAWDVMRVRRRTAAEREEVARYVTDLIEAKAGLGLVVSVRSDCDNDILSGCVVQADSPDIGETLWTGLFMGNVVGNDDAVAYSIVLFPFAGGRRLAPRDGGDAPLRSFSVIRENGALRVWASGDCDEWGEWAGVEQPLDVVDEWTDVLRAAVRRLGLNPAESG